MSSKDFQDTESTERKYLQAFGQSLKSLRTNSAKKSLRLFAYETDVPCATLSRIENGVRIPNIIILKRIASGFNLSLPQLIEKIENTIPSGIKNIDL